MRSAVVLPEPDGPTSTMNSPSSMWRSSASTAGIGVARVEPRRLDEADVSHRSAPPPRRARSRRRCAARPGPAPSSSSPSSAAPTIAGDAVGADDEARADLVQAGLDRAREPLVPGAKQAAAEQHLDRLLRQLEPDERGPRERDDLVGEVVDDLRRDSSSCAASAKTSGASSTSRRCAKSADVDRLGELDGVLEPEVRRARCARGRLRRRARPRCVRRRRAPPSPTS